MPGGAEADKIPTRHHVDDTIFGVIPLEIGVETKDPKYLTWGQSWADKQWESPQPDGLSDETRYWIDDMYMLTILQLEAYRATGDKKYLDRDATEMVAYLDKLQQPNGLFLPRSGCAVLLGPGRWLGCRGHGGDAARSARGPSAAGADPEGLQANDGRAAASTRARTACGVSSSTTTKPGRRLQARPCSPLP